MIKKKGILLFMAGLMIWGLCSCTLADPKAGNRGADQLIGGFATLEQIDYEDGDEKIYAQIREEKGEIKEIRFDGMEGWGLYFLEKTEGAEKVNYPLFDRGMSPGSINAGNENSIEGTLYHSAGKRVVFYLTPVYRTSEGRIYLAPGEGAAGASTELTDGNALIQSIHSKIEGHVAGKAVGGSDLLVKAYLKGVYRSEKVVVKQFDQQGNLLKEENIDLSDPAETMNKAQAMAYAVVETHTKVGVQRKIFSQGEEIELFTFDNQGIGTLRTIKIQ